VLVQQAVTAGVTAKSNNKLVVIRESKQVTPGQWQQRPGLVDASDENSCCCTASISMTATAKSAK